MAGAKKHMQRSHRSNQQSKAGIFNTFERKAYSLAYTKAQKLTLGQRISKTFKNLFKRTKAC